jgi:hypothetical protein
MSNDQLTTASLNASGALRPHRLHQSQPLLELLTKFASASIVDAAQLIHESELAEQWDPSLALSDETSTGQPGEQVQRGRGARERLGCLKVGRNRDAP